MNDDQSKLKVSEPPPLRLLDEKILKEHRKKTRFKACLELLITAAAVFLLFGVILGVAVVDGDSMKPGLTDGSIAIFNRLSSQYEKNDIVIFKTEAPNDILIKRVIAVAGDVISIDDTTGTLFVNNMACNNDEVIGKTYSRDGIISFPYTVPAGCVFVLGDNREVALDSRDFGGVDTADIIGKVVLHLKVMTH